MPERVAEIQQRAPALLTFVLGDDSGLDLAAAPDRVRQCRGVEPREIVDVLFEPREERRIDDDAVLDDLCEPGGKLARRQRAQSARVGENGDRLVERAD